MSSSVPIRTDGRTAVVLTAIPVEFAAVRTHLCDIREETHPQGTVYDVGTFDAGSGVAWTVALVEVGAGNDVAAFELERAVEHFGATHALFVGVAGGLKDVALGDVVAATKIYGYEAGKAAEEFLPRPDVGEPSYDLLQRAKVVARDAWAPVPAPGGPDAGSAIGPKAYLGAIAAGAKVVANSDSETAKLLRQQYGDALAVEMEGRGFARAAHARPNLRLLVVRGISDQLDQKGESDRAGWQVVAARNAAAFAFRVLEGLTPAAPATPVGTATTPAAPPRRDATGPSPCALSEPPDLVGLLASLYPEGPRDRHVWERAGGDLSKLDLAGAAHSVWYGAVKLLQQGGGPGLGALLSVAQSDFPANAELRAVSGSSVASGPTARKTESP